MDTTPRGYHFAEGGDALGDVNIAMQALAEDVDDFEGSIRAHIASSFDHIERGTLHAPISGDPAFTSGSVRVNFARPFAATPHVVVTGHTNQVMAFVEAPDAAGFSIHGRFFSAQAGFDYTFIAIG